MNEFKELIDAINKSVESFSIELNPGKPIEVDRSIRFCHERDIQAYQIELKKAQIIVMRKMDEQLKHLQATVDSLGSDRSTLQKEKGILLREIENLKSVPILVEEPVKKKRKSKKDKTNE